MHRIQYGARLKVDDGDKIKRGQRIAEWDPYTRPIITEVDGIVGYEDLVEGASMSETADESTGIAKRVVTDWRATRAPPICAPRSSIKGKDGKMLKLPRGGDARYLLAVDAIIAVDPGRPVKAGDVRRAYLDGERQDARHHGRSAARGGAVRGAPAEGSRDHRREARARCSSAATTRTSGASRIEPARRAPSRSST